MAASRCPEGGPSCSQWRVRYPGFPWSLRSSTRPPRYGFQHYADIGDEDLLGGSDKRRGGAAGAGNISEDKLSIIESLLPDRAGVEAQIRAAFAGASGRRR